MQNILHRAGPKNVLKTCPVNKNYMFLIICLRLISGKWTARELNHISTFFFLAFFYKSIQSWSETFEREIATKKVFNGSALHFN